MSENTVIENTVVDEETTVEETELTFEEIVSEIVDEVYGTNEMVTAYKIAKIVNAVFAAYEFDKTIPPQMMYNYAKNGMINKIKDMKQQYAKDQATAFVIRYTKKQMGI